MSERSEFVNLANSVLKAETNDFLALTGLAKLDPYWDFRHANLRDVDFRDSDLSGFIFFGADLRGSDFTHAKFDPHSLAGAIIDESTKFPDGAPPKDVKFRDGRDEGPINDYIRPETLQGALQQSSGSISKEVETYFDGNRHTVDPYLADAMRYAVGEGKRLRAHLVREAFGLFSEESRAANRVAMAIEFVHAYTLVHDDLPSMDDDDLRRGKPTIHKKWDEATAILAGNSLHTAAFEILSDSSLKLEANTKVEIIGILSRSIGASGVNKGQILDILAEGASEQLTLEEIVTLQQAKTGAFLTACCEVGAVLGGASKDERNRLVQYGEKIGLAFQIADDLLDVALDRERHEPISTSALANAGKATFVSLLGVKGAKAKALELIDSAKHDLDCFGDRAKGLRELADFIVSRNT